MTDRVGFILLPAIALLVACAVMARTDAALLGTPPEPLTAGKHFVVTDTRANTMIACTRLLGIPAHTCTYQRTGDTIPTIYISIEDVGPVYKHELFHAQQAELGQPMNHKDWK
jgi:hypothetical protein